MLVFNDSYPFIASRDKTAAVKLVGDFMYLSYSLLLSLLCRVVP
jgi:hypothetical protein